MISTLLYALRAPVISLYTTDDAIARVAHSLFGPLGALITLQVSFLFFIFILFFTFSFVLVIFSF